MLRLIKGSYLGMSANYIAEPNPSFILRVTNCDVVSTDRRCFLLLAIFGKVGLYRPLKFIGITAFIIKFLFYETGTSILLVQTSINIIRCSNRFDNNF